MTLLECINGPEDLKGLSQEQLTMLAAETRLVQVPHQARAAHEEQQP